MGQFYGTNILFAESSATTGGLDSLLEPTGNIKMMQDATARAMLLTTAYTMAEGDRDLTAPWSGYPGYTSVQVEDFNRQDEDAWLVRAQYTWPKDLGLSAYVLYVAGTDPAGDTAYGRGETDYNLQWSPPEGTLKGLMVRLRYAHVAQDDPGDTDLNDLRVMVYYDLPL